MHEDSIPTLISTQGVIEAFLPVPEFPHYQISNHGSVRSLRRGNKRKGFGPYWKKLKVRHKKTGYAVLDLVRGKIRRTVHVHRLVLELFVGPCPDGCEACHEDGNPRNNRVDNLRWDTKKNNMADCIRHGRTTRGEKNAMAKLQEAEVREMFALRSQGWTHGKIAARFHVSRPAVSMALEGKTWKHLAG